MSSIEEKNCGNLSKVYKGVRPILLDYDEEEDLFIPYRGEFLISKNDAKRLIEDLKRYLTFSNIDEANKEIESNNRIEYANSAKNNTKSPQPSYLYLMRSGNSIKIGISRNPENRLQQLSIGNSNIELIYKKLYSNATKIEERLHKKFIKKKIYGEWFNLDQKDIDFITKGQVILNEQ